MNKNLSPDCFRMPSQALSSPSSITRIALLAAFAGTLACAGPVRAAPADVSSPSQNAIGHDQKTDRGPKAMAKHLEERIDTLHEKLGITSAQEAKWGDVAQTMRDNEATIAALIEARHKNPKDKTAIEDLQSYQEITQAHADGIKKLLVSFQTLYADMSDDQKEAADEAFGRFEGHRDDKSAKKHK